MTETTICAPRFLDVDFAYFMSDSSMIGVRIAPGDIVLVRQQDSVENGDIALAYHNGEVRIGRYSRRDDCEALTPASDEYATIISSVNNPSFKIFGKAVAFMGALEKEDDEAIRKETVGQ